MPYSMPLEIAEALAEQASAIPNVTAKVEQSKKQRGYRIFLRHKRERLQSHVYTKLQFESLLLAWSMFEDGGTANAALS